MDQKPRPPSSESPQSSETTQSFETRQPSESAQSSETTQSFESPPPPQGAPQQSAPVWYEQTQALPQHPAYPPMVPKAPAEPRPAVFTQPGAEPAQSAKSRRLAEIGTVAVLAAVLASAGTYGLTRDDLAMSPAAQTRTGQTNQNTTAAPVVQANASAPNWSATAAAVAPSVVAITVESGEGSGQGSGVILDTKGHIVTNNHVVAAGGQGSQISVTLDDKRTYDATVVGTDPSTDLAVIKLTNAPNDLKAVALGNDSSLKVGEPVMAVGNPLGLAGTVTTGIVSALNRPVTTTNQDSDDSSGRESRGEPVVTNAIQTSAAINPGNSGGALVNAGGQLIGINSSIASLGSERSSSQSGNIGIGFAIPINEVRSISDQLITSGKATHPYLGVSSDDGVVPDGSAKRAAAVLTDIVAGTPADKAGLKAGDAITAVDGDSIDGSKSLVAQVRERSVGDKITLKIVRDGQTKTIDVTLISKPTTNQ